MQTETDPTVSDSSGGVVLDYRIERAEPAWRSGADPSARAETDIGVAVTVGGRGPGVELRVARFGQRIGVNERQAERRLKLKLKGVLRTCGGLLG